MSYFTRLFPVLGILLGLLALAQRARAADPTTADCIAANDGSISSRNDHNLRAARAQLLVCAASACPADVRTECTRRVAEVNAAMPTVVFAAKDQTGKDLAAVKVTMDGEPLADRLDGTALSVDPGEHSFVFDAEGQAQLTKQLVMREGEKERHESITFGETASPPGAPAAVLPVAPPPAPPPARFRLGAQRYAAIASTGVGVVGVVLGAVFGAEAAAKKSDAQRVCPASCATQSGVDAWSKAKTAGDVATVALIVGGLGLAGGAALWFTAKDEHPSAEAGQGVGLGLGTIQLKGTW